MTDKALFEMTDEEMVEWANGMLEQVRNLKARIAVLETPTMYWPGDETMSQEDEGDLVDILASDQEHNTVQEYQVMCGRTLPDRTVRVTVKENAEYEWEWIDDEKS